MIVRFHGTDGTPPGGVTFDPLGNLFGTTPYGGNGPCNGPIVNGCGVLYELSPTSGGLFTHKIIRQFASNPVAAPNNVAIDGSGNVFGTSVFGGKLGCGVKTTCGTIYEVVPKAGGGFTFSLLHAFQGGADGFFPYAAVNIDSAGNIYGTTGAGGNLNCGATGGCGLVFQIVP